MGMGMGMGMDDRLKLPKLLDWYDLWFLDIMAFGLFMFSDDYDWLCIVYWYTNEYSPRDSTSSRICNCKGHGFCRSSTPSHSTNHCLWG